MIKYHDSIIAETKEIVFDQVIEEQLRTTLQLDQLNKARENASKVRIYQLKYRSNGHLVSGFVVVPRNGSSLPAIIYNRGGNRHFFPLKLGHLFLKLAVMAQWGYIIAASQYSGGPGSEGNDEFGGSELTDVLNLKEVLRLYPETDTERIGMCGASRGGMMTYLSLAKVDWIRGAVVTSGLADLHRASVLRPEMKKVFKECFGGSKKEMDKRSALCFAEKISKESPLLLMHGSSDWRVSPFDSLELSGKLYKNRIPHRFVFFEGADHYLSECREESLALTKEWLDRFVKNKSPLPDLSPHGH